MLLRHLREKEFDIRFESHAGAILEKDFPAALREIEQVLANVTVPITEIIGSGGGETKGTQRMRRALNDLDWKKGKFEIKKTINGIERESISHEVDHIREVKGRRLALEIECKKNDSFFDQDPEGFNAVHRGDGSAPATSPAAEGSGLKFSLRI